MIEAEYWKDKLRKIGDLSEFGVLSETGEPYECSRVRCSQCKFYAEGECVDLAFKWLLSEHIEKPKLTKRERAFCEFAGSGYVVRDKDGRIAHFEKKPIKELYDGFWAKFAVSEGEVMPFYVDLCSLFPFVQWDDKEPWAVEDLLKLEVMDDD